MFPAEMVTICSMVARQSQMTKRTLTTTGEQESVEAVEDTEAQAMAERIVEYARMCMHNRKRVSPFERAAAREGMYFRGGVSLELFTCVQPVADSHRPQKVDE